MPTRRTAQESLDKLSHEFGLKRRRQGGMHYLVTRSSAIKVFRQFDWFVRRSWGDKRFAILWAVIYLAEVSGWEEEAISLDSIAELAECNRKLSADLLEQLGVRRVSTNDTTGYLVNKEEAVFSLEKLLPELPSWTEEVVMRTLCSGIGNSVAEIHEKIMTLGLSVGATYKIVERLKSREYILPLKHYRVNERGPMRELLSANCRNCFYGYSSQEHCLADVFRQLEDIMQRLYGKKLGEDERDYLLTSIKSIPYSSRIGRRVYELLGLVHDVERIAGEGGVISFLDKLETHYGITLPINKQPSNQNGRVGN